MHHYFRILICFILLAISSHVSCFAEYIPTYANYIQIVDGNDTIFNRNCLEDLEMISQDGSVIVSVQQEIVDKVKIKDIKRARRQKRLAVAAVVLRSIHMVLNPIRNKHELLHYINDCFALRTDVHFLAVAKANEASEKILDVEFIVENITDKEIQVSNVESGLTWYVLPQGALHLKASNPDVANLRIANTDPFNMAVKYVFIAAASKVENKSVKFEDDEYQGFKIYRFVRNGEYQETDFEPGIGTYTSMEVLYRIRDKESKEERLVDEDEYKAWVKERKALAKQNN